MRYLKMFASILLMLVWNSCSKGSGGGSPIPKVTPSNLVVAATVLTGNSGMVTFTASANNAVSYDFNFGDGNTQTASSGIISYKYMASGNYTVNVTAKSKDGLSVSKSTDIAVTLPASTTATWSEEFNTDGAPDPNIWGYDIGTGSNGWGNSELEYYTNRTDNVYVSNGTLKIVLKKEGFSGSNYTSARLTSKGKSFKYGKIEIRAKLPAGGGTWPALWMLGSNYQTVAWPGCGEMDIMEEVGNQPDKIFGTFHYPGHSGANGSGSTTLIANTATSFHRYQMDWQPTTIKFLVDDVPYYTLANNGSLPFNANFFMILNVAMGGTFGGAVDPAFTSATMEVDYIRYYQ